MTHLDSYVTLLPSIFDTSTFEVMPLREALERLTNEWRDEVERVRTLTGKAQKRAKERLPAFAFSGAFKRSVVNDDLDVHSGVVVIDYDGVGDPWKFIGYAVEPNPHALAAWPSARGEGVKVLIALDKRPKSNAEHRVAFAQVCRFLDVTAQEESQHDVRRLCFVSAPDRIWINDSVVPFEVDLSEEARPKRAEPVGDTIPHGTQHNTLVSLAGSMRRRGMDADAIFAALWQTNITRCEKPGSEAAIRKIAESMMRYDPEDGTRSAITLDVDAWLEGKEEATDGEVIEALAALSSVEYDRRREAACKRLKIRVGTLDAEVKARRPEEPEEVEDTFETPEPWPEEVDAEELLSEVYETIRRYVVFEEADAVACTLWTLHSYALEAAEASPILAITSPEKRCGKTTLLLVLGALAYRPASGASFTKAAIYRVIEKYHPTLVIDEADTFMKPGQNEELRGVINSGHTRGTAHVWVCVGDDHEPTRFSTWAPKVIACIGELPDTIADRSIEVKMRRKTGSDKVERFRSRAVRELLPLRRRMRRWAEDNVETLADSDPDVPRSLNDRAADSWATLLAVADRAGGDWPRRARHAAETLSGSTTADVATRGTELLSDLRQIFESRGNPDALPTADILEALHAMEERPWPTYHRGKELSARGLASLLKPFEVTSISVRLPDGSTPKGYKLAALHDTFARYLPPTSATAPQTEKNGDSEPETAISAESASATDSPVSGGVADRKTAKYGDSGPETANPPDLWRVADKNGGPGGEGVSGDDNVLYIDPSDPDPLPF